MRQAKPSGPRSSRYETGVGAQSSGLQKMLPPEIFYDYPGESAPTEKRKAWFDSIDPSGEMAKALLNHKPKTPVIRDVFRRPGPKDHPRQKLKGV